MINEIKGIHLNAVRLSWYMRGGVNFIDIMNMSHDQIDAINKIIDDNLETTKKSKLPFFWADGVLRLSDVLTSIRIIKELIMSVLFSFAFALSFDYHVWLCQLTPSEAKGWHNRSLSEAIWPIQLIINYW